MAYVTNMHVRRQQSYMDVILFADISAVVQHKASNNFVLSIKILSRVIKATHPS